MLTKPTARPDSPNFSSGPCRKRPGYDVSALKLDTLGRSHRGQPGKDRLRQVCEETAQILGLPEGYRVGIVPASDTGAVEMAMWSLLGARPVDVFAWESFGLTWKTDITESLRLEKVRSFTAEYGEIPDLQQADPAHDIVFAWNGTTSGVRVPDADWISDAREGLTICDATSAAFAMPLPWHKLDVATFSWQKALGGEAAHGMLILSPRAVERLESHTPTWPVPKIFRLTRNGRLNEGIFLGSTINTPSMLCVADYLDALAWVQESGGLEFTIRRSQESLAVIERFVSKRDWISFLAKKPETRSSTSVCLALDLTADAIAQMVRLLNDEGVAYDIGAYRAAPPGLRIWCGATVPVEDIEALMPWLDWAYQTVHSA